MVKRPRLDRDGHLCGLGRGVDVVREFRVPIAEAVRGVGEPAEIAVGAPAQRFFGCRRLVLERLQLGDLVQQTGEIAVLRAGDLGAVIQIGARGRTRSSSAATSATIRKNRRTPMPFPRPQRRTEPRYSRGRSRLSSLTIGHAARYLPHRCPLQHGATID